MGPPGESGPTAGSAPPAGNGRSRPKGASGAATLQADYHFLTHLLRCSVHVEGAPTAAGRLDDIGVRKTAPYPFVSTLRILGRGREGWIDYPWSAVLEIAPPRVVLRKGSCPETVGADFWLRRDILDDQVIDLSGSKVVRVNDLHLLHTEGRMIVVHVDVGFRGILRRLRFSRLVVGLLRWLFDYELKNALVPWKCVEFLGPEGHGRKVRLAAGPDRLLDMHPAELADIMEQLGTSDRHELLDALPLEAAAEALEEVDPELQRAYIAQQEPGKAADILEEMNSTDAADVLRDLHSSEAQLIMSKMERQAAEDIREILAHEEKTAGGIMSTECIEIRPDQLAGEVLRHVRSIADEVEVFNQIYVVGEDRRLLGVLSLRELLVADPEATLRSFMRTEVVSVHSDAGLADVARTFVKYAFRAIPVVDDAGTFLGAIRLVSVLSKLSRFFGRED